VRIEIPSDASVDGHLVDGVISYLTVATGIAFAALVVVLAITLIRDRARPDRRTGRYVHGNRPRDQLLTFAVGLTMFGAIDAVLATRAARDLAGRFWRYPDADPRALRVEVTAQQWAWTFRTAGPDGRFATADDVVTLGELHVPIGRPVYLKLRSKDVVHSLYLPNFRTKLDAIPGSTTKMWLEAAAPGRYEIGCAQHCGVSHYKMRGLLIAETEDDYQAWLGRAETDSRLRNEADPTREGWDWETGR
jgi:cytochrome c oxidase subunit 2